MKLAPIRRYMLCFLLALGTAAEASATEISIDQFPRTIAAGQPADLRVSWKGFKINKEYIMRVQLQDSEATPPIFVFQDFEIDKSEGAADIALKLPYTVTASKSAKFVAALISRKKVWDDILCTTDTGSIIEILSDFRFSIDEYPGVAFQGDSVQLRVSWKGVKAGKDYKLIIQLENWQQKPGFAYVARLDDFDSEGICDASIKIPNSVPEAKNCRFVAAFISKIKNWEDVYAITATPNDISILKYKPL